MELRSQSRARPIPYAGEAEIGLIDELCLVEGRATVPR